MTYVTTEFEYRRRRVKSGVRGLGNLLSEFSRTRGVDATQGGYSFVVSADGAALFMREIFSGLMRAQEIEITDIPDELFRFRRIPVRLRFESTPGVCYLTKNGDVPERTCCDRTSTASVMVTLSRGST